MLSLLVPAERVRNWFRALAKPVCIVAHVCVISPVSVDSAVSGLLWDTSYVARVKTG